MRDEFNPFRGLNEYCGVSTSSGKCMWGDRESRDEVLTWRHSHSIVPELKAEILRERGARQKQHDYENHLVVRMVLMRAALEAAQKFIGHSGEPDMLALEAQIAEVLK